MTVRQRARRPLPIIVPHHSIAKTMNANLTRSHAADSKSRWPYLLIWLPTLVLIAAWSLFAWAGLALAGWFGWAATDGGGTGGWNAWVNAFALPVWLAPWMPDQALEGIKGMLAAIGPLMEYLAASKPDLLSGLMVLVVVLWAVGAVLLVFAGLAASIAVGVWRRRIQPALAARR